MNPRDAVKRTVGEAQPMREGTTRSRKACEFWNARLSWPDIGSPIQQLQDRCLPRLKTRWRAVSDSWGGGAGCWRLHPYVLDCLQTIQHECDLHEIVMGLEAGAPGVDSFEVDVAAV
jgi:hypothetical protein